MMDFLSQSISLIFELVIKLTDLLLTPLNLLIANYLPDLNTAFDYVNNFFNRLANVAGFVMSWTGLTYNMINCIVIVWIAILTIPPVVNVSKILIEWFSSLKG